MIVPTYPSVREAIVLGSLLFSYMRLIHPVLHMLSNTDRNYDRLTMPIQNNQDEFDFIIVGGGSSGCALANRLSESYSVLLLEAGGAPSIMQYFPFYTFFLYGNPSIDWVHKTVPQKNASFGLINNSVLWSNGKLLGGSSQLNAMMYIRGNVQGFDDIARNVDNSRWSMNNVLQYYKRMENYNGWFDSVEHGKGGSLEVERPELVKLTKNLMSAGEELGYRVRDPNAYGPYTEGFAMMDLYMKGGRRSDAFKQFLVPIMNIRRNLVIRKYSLVTRILFAAGTTRAVGVEYERHGRRFQARAKKEVILSGGALKSAKLLMLSGIGPKEHLEEIGIAPLVNLPVGQYLQDKYGALVGPFLVDKGHSVVYDRDLTLVDFVSWVKFGTGRFKSSLAEATWAIHTNRSSSKSSHRSTTPDIHAYVLSVSFTEDMKEAATNSFNINPEVASFFALANKNDSFYQLVTINRQKGHGHIKLSSSDPHEELEIDPKYLEDEDDFQTLVEGLKFSVKLVEETESFKQIHGRLMPIPIPGCESFPFKSDEYFGCLARQVTVSAFKYSSTCPVGKDTATDPYAVVDSSFKVFGTEGLRVVDGSVLQQKYVSINDVTCRMLGLLAGDIILDELNNNPITFNDNDNTILV